MKLKVSDFIKKIIIQIIFISYSLTIIGSLYVLLISPFRSRIDISRGVLTLPNSFTFENFVSAWNKGINYGFRNSLFFGIITCIITILIGGIAAYGLAFLRFKFRNFWYLLMTSGIFLSIMVIVLPLFLQYSSLHLINSFIGVIIIYVGIRLPFTVYIFRNYFLEFPVSILEAAKIDGANEMGMFTKIVLPLSKPVVVTAAIFNFITVWTELLVGLLFLQNPKNQTLMLKIMNIFTSELMSTGEVAPLTQGFAGLFISTIPIILIYFFTKKYYLEGLTMGSIK
ncbi:MAG: carbohydrate ABC transporter permease [Actinobacteria bacterium]|nr:carbohydrate ABC transporter permease [Actinomycetota bacterium]